MIEQFCEWLASTSLSQLFGRLSWVVPLVQTLHILSIAVVVTSLAMMDFRLLRLTKSGPTLPEMSRSFMPWTWGALVVLLATGILLTITEPSRELLNLVFRLKMALVLLLVLLTLAFQQALRKDPEYWSASPQRRRIGGLIGVVSLMLCISIVTAGRMIAYVSN